MNIFLSTRYNLARTPSIKRCKEPSKPLRQPTPEPQLVAIWLTDYPGNDASETERSSWPKPCRPNLCLPSSVSLLPSLQPSFGTEDPPTLNAPPVYAISQRNPSGSLDESQGVFQGFPSKVLARQRVPAAQVSKSSGLGAAAPFFRIILCPGPSLKQNTRGNQEFMSTTAALSAKKIPWFRRVNQEILETPDSSRLERYSSVRRDGVPSGVCPIVRETSSVPMRETWDLSDSEDIENVNGFLAGDQQAFENLFDKYRSKVYNIAYQFVRNKEDALEVTQEVFLRVFLGLKQFKTRSRFFTWLYRIAVNCSIDFTRSRKIQPLVGIDSVKFESGDHLRHGQVPDPVDKAQERELEEYLAQAIECLSPKHRAVFVLHASEKLSYKQIAEVLGCNVGTVMSRLFYARKKLQEFLSNLGIDVSDKRGNK